jgi:hypothetical protein
MTRLLYYSELDPEVPHSTDTLLLLMKKKGLEEIEISIGKFKTNPLNNLILTTHGNKILIKK